MTWNWQKRDCHNFRWDRARLEAAERQFLVSGVVLSGSIRHLGPGERDQLTVETLSAEAVTTRMTAKLDPPKACR